MTDVRTLDEEHERQRLAETVRLLEAGQDRLTESGIEVTMLDYDSTSFAGGAIITSAHIAKGLEFDVVIVPYVDDATYATEMDRGMLYIACTRTMHELQLTHDGPVSPLLEFAAEPIPSVA